MTDNIVQFKEYEPNKLGYEHCICTDCHGDAFHIKTIDCDNDDPKFYSLICVKCGSEIFCNLQPVFPPSGD